jgi:hypothetical protein
VIELATWPRITAETLGDRLVRRQSIVLHHKRTMVSMPPQRRELVDVLGRMVERRSLERTSHDVTDLESCLAERHTPATDTAGNAVTQAGNDAQATEETRR